MKNFRMKFYKIAMCLFPACMFAQDTTSKKLSLSACIEIALKNNLDVQRSDIQSEAAHINLLQSRENILPVVNANIQHGVNEGRSIDPYTNSYVNQQISYGNQDISSSLLLFNGLALQSMMRQSSFAFQATKAQEQQIKDNLSLNVILIYLQVLTNKDLLLLLSAQRETTSKQLERSQLLYDKGSISPAIYYDLKGQLMNDELAVLNAKNTLENSKIALAQLLNQPYDKRMELEEVEIDSSAFKYDINPEDLYKIAEQNLALVKAADLNVKKTAMQIRYARSGYYPSVYLRGGLYSNFSSAAYDPQSHPIGYLDQVSNNLGKSLNVGVAIPLFNNLRTRNNVSKAKLAHLESQLTAEATRKQLQQLTEQAYVNMITAKERCAILNEQVLAFSESFKTADVRFNLGVINSVDYLVSKNNLEKTKVNLVSSRYDFILRKKIVDFYEGKL
jgi:outer membrane protein